MTDLYPLRFHPLLQRYLWGGRRLERELGKSLPEGDDYAESWEVVDRGEDQSVVSDGPFAGQSLGRLITLRGQEMLGRHYQPHFPLLFKFLDAHRNLSVQVHPDDEGAARLDPPDLGKTEAWVVLHAEAGSVLYAGLNRDFDRAALESEVNRGRTEHCLHKIVPQVGDCIFIPAGTVHALGAGLVVAEIQQASDTTFRLFDWNRLDNDGKPRKLHVEQALEAIDYSQGKVRRQEPQATDCPHVFRLATCDKFVLDRWEVDSPQSIGGDGRCHILAVLKGRVEVAGDEAAEPLATGETIFLPAGLEPVALAPLGKVRLLDMYLP